MKICRLIQAPMQDTPAVVTASRFNHVWFLEPSRREVRVLAGLVNRQPIKKALDRCWLVSMADEDRRCVALHRSPHSFTTPRRRTPDYCPLWTLPTVLPCSATSRAGSRDLSAHALQSHQNPSPSERVIQPLTSGNERSRALAGHRSVPQSLRTMQPS